MPCGSTSRLSKVPPLVADTRASGCTVASHEAMKADPTAWAALPARPDWRVLGSVIQLRDCPRCQSTLAKRIDGGSDAAIRRGE